MSYADRVFVDMCKDILENGEELEVRPTWKDTGVHAKVIKKFGVVNRYDLREEFPAMTLRPVSFNKCIDEILWIFQQKSNNIADLDSNIWDSWADERGTIGKAYGYQIGNCFRKVKTDKGELLLDQTDYVLHELKYNQSSRRIMTNIFNVDQLDQMRLEPCCYSMTYNVTHDSNGTPILNGILNQRSNDILVANNWNVVQYAALMCMFAQVCKMIPGEFVHIIADAHIYDRHIPIIQELIKRTQFNAPTLWINPEIDDFYDITINDIKLLDYNSHKQIKRIPVAV